MSKALAEPVLRFNGEYAFLSNFSPHHVRSRDGRIWPTAEHAFQAWKTQDRTLQEWIRSATSAAEAKRRGRSSRVTLKPFWNELRIPVMHQVVKSKFEQHPELAAMLFATKDRTLVEGNTWHDTFWGVCICTRHADESQPFGGPGDNVLGQILMTVREELR